MNKAVYVFNNAIDFSKKSIKEMVIVLNENVPSLFKPLDFVDRRDREQQLQ